MPIERIQSERSEIESEYKRIESQIGVASVSGLILEVDNLLMNPLMLSVLADCNSGHNVFHASSIKPGISILAARSLAQRRIDSQELHTLMYSSISTSGNSEFAWLIAKEAELLEVSHIEDFNQKVLDDLLMNPYWCLYPKTTLNNAKKELDGSSFYEQNTDGNLDQVLKFPPTQMWNSGPIGEVMLLSLLPYFPAEACILFGIKDSDEARIFTRYLETIKNAQKGIIPYTPPSIRYRLSEFEFSEKCGWWTHLPVVQPGDTPQLGVGTSINTYRKRTVFGSISVFDKLDGGVIVIGHNVVLKNQLSKYRAEKKMSGITNELAQMYRAVLHRHL